MRILLFFIIMAVFLLTGCGAQKDVGLLSPCINFSSETKCEVRELNGDLFIFSEKAEK